jgi:hypothetical protein
VGEPLGRWRPAVAEVSTRARPGAPSTHLHDPFLQLLPHELISTALDRGEISRHLLILLLLELQQRRAVLETGGKEARHGVRVSRRPRAQLCTKRHLNLTLTLCDGSPLRGESVLGRLQLGGLFGTQRECLLKALMPPLPELAKQRLRRCAGIGLLGRERRRERAREEDEPAGHGQLGSDFTRWRSSAGVSSSIPDSMPAGSSSTAFTSGSLMPFNTSPSWCAESPLTSTATGVVPVLR